eukprot:14553925-Heterocapsa_arctica.AAC.1
MRAAHVHPTPSINMLVSLGYGRGLGQQCPALPCPAWWLKLRAALGLGGPWQGWILEGVEAKGAQLSK